MKLHSENILKTRALTKSVQLENKALDLLQPIDLEVNAGDTLAIVGSSGSGKTTLLSILAGLDLPTSGEYAIPGDLQTLAQTMRSGGTPSADMRRIALRDFGHMSSNFDKIGMSPEPGFERSIDWNDAGQAK